jgi:hypothetical protein
VIPRGVRRLVIAAIWATAFLGLFAMHGLADHGAGGHDAMSSTMDRGVGHALVDLTGATAQVSPRHVGDELTAPGVPPGVGSASGLCLAIIGGLASLLLALLARRRRVVTLPVPGSVAALGAGRERDPPCRVRLSVMRC